MATRYIKKYADETAIHTAVDNKELLNPYVAYDESAGTIDWNGYLYIDYSKEPLTFDIISGGTIKWYCGSEYNVSERKVISYSTDNGETWTNITATTNTTINVNAGDTIKFKGDNATYYQSYYNSFQGSTATFNIKGNIMSLIDSTGFTTATTLTNNNYQCFYSLFVGCNVVDASKLILPATTLAGSCYSSMFSNCNSLTTAPELPATTLVGSCYYQMFLNCNSLTTAPELPATTLADYCYAYMFRGCTGLTTAPALPATTLANNCYSNMFFNCQSLTSAPELPATTLAGSCYNNMFYYCSNLTTAPELPATTLTQGCYQGMFNGCNSLNYIKCLATDISASNCTTNWVVGGVSATGTFVKKAGVNWPTGNSGIPNGWTVEEV